MGLLGCLGRVNLLAVGSDGGRKRHEAVVLRTSCAESHAGAQRDGQQDRGGGILEHLAGYRQIGDIRRHGRGLCVVRCDN